MKTKAVSMLAAVLLLFPIQASAIDYHYESGGYDGQFYQSTSVDDDHLSSSGSIVVGADGTISNKDGVSSPSSSPLSVLDLPVGEYPDAWGSATDIAIAQNSIFPNALAPTTQMSGISGYVTYDYAAVPSGALPTPNTFSNGYHASLGHVTPISAGYAAPTSQAAMPAITQGGAIAQLSIPSINLSKYVYEGTSSNNMSKGLAHFSETSGWAGNIAIAGHNRGTKVAHFARLKDVKIGDTMTLTTGYGTKTYQATNIIHVNTTDTYILNQDGADKLTLITCVAGDPSKKLCVIAHRI